MVTVNVPVGFFRDRRVLALPRTTRAEAIGIYVRALCYTREQELDGYCPRGAVHMFGRQKLVDQLVAVGLFTRDERDGKEHVGYLLPDFLLWNESKRQLADRKPQRRERRVPIHIQIIIGTPYRWTVTLDDLQVTHSRCNVSKGNRLQ